MVVGAVYTHSPNPVAVVTVKNGCNFATVLPFVARKGSKSISDLVYVSKFKFLKSTLVEA